MKKNFILLLLLFLTFTCFSQSINYKYDNANRLIQVTYPNQLSITYTYDADGNRISQTTAISIPTSVKNPSDSSNLINGQLILYPNPTSDIIRGKFYLQETQPIVFQINDISGHLIAEYKANLIKGFQEFTFDIKPLPASGTYIITIIGKSASKSGKIIIGHQ